MVVGAVATTLPPHLRFPERCWLVAPHEWKAALGLKGKPTKAWLQQTFPDGDIWAKWGPYPDRLRNDADWQNAYDAYCLAMFCRDENAKAVAKALAAQA